MPADPTNLRGAALEYASSSREKAFGRDEATIDAMNAIVYGLVYVGDQIAARTPQSSVKVLRITGRSVLLQSPDGAQDQLMEGDTFKLVTEVRDVGSGD